MAIAEGDLIRAARLRELVGISRGQSVESALHYRDKIKMKERLKSAGICVPSFSEVDSVTEIVKWAETEGFPFVLKPMCGYSSVNTVAIKSREALERVLEGGWLEGLAGGMDARLALDVERFVEGPMYHVDGFFHQGRPFCMWPSKYLNTCIDFGANNFLASYSLHPSNPLVPRLLKFVSDVIAALPSPQSFPFHAEVWVSPSDKQQDSDLVLCESKKNFFFF